MGAAAKRSHPQAAASASRVRAARVGQGAALGFLAVGLLLSRVAPDAHYRLVQEDELLEWSTFWCFALAGLLNLWLARTHWSPRPLQAWFPLALAAFCFFVALEEISWGQRVLGFRPPEYFLAQNYQMELNVHNLLGSTLRKAAMLGVIVGQGLLLPLAPRHAGLQRLMARLHVVPSPAELLPLFAVTLLLQLWYPIRFSGEWVEMLLGAGFLLAAALQAREPCADPQLNAVCVLPWRVLAIAAGVALAAVLSTAWSRGLRTASPQAAAAARVELEALANDAAHVGAESHRQAHKRIHTFVANRKAWAVLGAGEFTALVTQGLPAERAAYQLDLWNSPYWLRHALAGHGQRRILVYSFGPNRTRDGVGFTLAGDDIGVERLIPAGRATPTAGDEAGEDDP